MPKKYIIEVPDKYYVTQTHYVTENFGTQILPFDNREVTAEDILKQLRRGFYLFKDLCFAELLGPIIVTPYPTQDNKTTAEKAR